MSSLTILRILFAMKDGTSLSLVIVSYYGFRNVCVVIDTVTGSLHIVLHAYWDMHCKEYLKKSFAFSSMKETLKIAKLFYCYYEWCECL